MAANAILHNSNIALEHPFLSQMYDTIVINGNYEMAEMLMDQAINGIYNLFVLNIIYINGNYNILEN